MPHKIVVTRTLPPGGAALLNASAASGAIEVVQWEPDTAADRSWLLTELRKGGVDGMIVFLGDKRLLGFGIGRALYTTSQPGATLPPSKDYFNLLTTSTIPIRAATSLDELAAESDFLIICCALTPETENLISADFLSKMKKTAYIVNTARGPVVDSDALVKAIEEGKLAGAGLDVVTGEPNIPADHPLVKNEKVVLLPHIGSATLETRNLMAEQSVQNLLAGLGLEGGVWANEVKL
ncbi:hypothetical protein P7C70_g3715, partial [Phenoliferia sp. Uapishka_3]